MPKTPFQRDAGGGSDLDRALCAWKREHSTVETLSEVTRARLLARAVVRTRRAPQAAPLFFPLKRLALAGALPLVLLTATVSFLVHQGFATAPGLRPDESPSIYAAKSAGEVVFTIANGDRPHAVRLSTVPNRFDDAPAIITGDGAFRDSLSGGPDLVFYRID